MSDTPRFDIRITTANGKVTKREVMFDQRKVADISKKELANLVAQAVFSLCDDDDSANVSR